MSGKKSKKKLLSEINESEASIRRSMMDKADIYATEQGWDINGMDVLYRLLAEKYRWTPSQVRSLTLEELAVFIDPLLDKLAKLQR